MLDLTLKHGALVMNELDAWLVEEASAVPGREHELAMTRPSRS
jgi:hypothetical protein